jgi:glycosyltransferase involved in cell wall biosynthesis
MKARKTIAFVISSLTAGGAERVVSLLCNKLSSEFNVSLFITSVRQSITYPVNPSVTVNYLSESKRLNPAKKISILKKDFKTLAPSVVVAFTDPCSYYAVKAARGLNIPVVCSERNSPKFSPSNFLMRMSRHFAYKQASGVVFQTQEARAYFSKSIQNKGVIIPNPVNSDFLCARAPLSEIKKVILFAGRLVPQKNVGMLIDSFALFHQKHSDYTLNIYGQGPLLVDLTAKVEKLGLKKAIIFCGHRANIQTLFPSAAIVALSSNHEGIPNVLLEALSAGVPCVCTDCPSGGPRELMKGNQFGFEVPVGDASCFADAMAKIVSDYPRFYFGAEEFSKEINSRYSMTKIGQMWCNYLSSIAG